MRVHLRHGWGYDAGFWAPLAALLETVSADDRGYFGARRADPAGDAPHLLVGHSFGVRRLLDEIGPACRGIVAINGFDRFVGGADHPGVAPRVIARMVRACANDPDATVAAFRRRCGDATPAPARATARLLDDLRRLAAANTGHDAALPLLRLDGADDPLLSPAHRAACFAGAAARDCADGGHLLPLTHPSWCAEAIARFAAALG